jgi:heparanase
MRGEGAVALVLMNTDAQREQSITLPQAGEKFTLTAPDLTSTRTMLNGAELLAGADGSVPASKGERIGAGPITLPPLSTTFVLIPGARNRSCR